MHYEHQAASTVRKTDVAVIGMSCRFPGASDYEAFWAHLAAGNSTITEVPASRWDWKAYWGDPLTEQNKSNSRWGGFLDGVDHFDPDFFGMAAKEVERMDPQQRILLELTWACLEDAGIRPATLSGQPVGVFLGVFNYDYKELQERGGDQAIEAHHSTGTAAAIIANRISYYYNFKGPSLPIDTACSSSLSALHAALQSIHTGESTLALAGGINLLLTPTRHISFSKTGMLSPTGSCKTFDDAANGYVRGEGAGLLLLKPLAQALADQDRIYGVIKGSAVNHGGKTYSLTYPNPEAQKEVILKAQQAAGVSPATISFIEAHGTGTPKGDPIEMQGLTTAFEAGAKEPLPLQYCAISSVKTNVGHLEAAAGVAGIIKVLLAMQHRQLPPLQNFHQLNHRISLANTPFYLVTSLAPWQPLLNEDQQPVPRRAGVSSFGFGGTNAHVVLEEAPAITPAPAAAANSAPCYGICLSGKTAQNLYAREKELASWLSSRIDQVSIADISHTLAAGREHFAVRTALVVRSTQDLYAQLQQLLGQVAGDNRNIDARPETAETTALFAETANTITNELATPGVSIEQYTAQLEALTRLYLRGYLPNWNQPCWGAGGRRIGLPAYPFTREAYWVPATLAAPPVQHLLRPLPTESTTAHGQTCTITFTGEEPFLRDHKVRGTQVLPAVACLEMARSAIASTMKAGQPKDAVIRLEHWSWLQPLEVQNNPRTLALRVQQQADGLVFCSITDPQSSTGSAYNEGVARFIQSPVPAPFSIETAMAACRQKTITQQAAYRALTVMGFDYGPTHQCITSVYCGDGQYLARLEATSYQVGSYVLHPGVLDAALQACLLVTPPVVTSQPALYLPFALDSLEIRQPIAANSWAWITPGNKRLHNGLQQFNIDVVDDAGALCVRLQGISFKQASTEQNAQYSTRQEYLLLAPQWRAAPLQEVATIAATQRRLLCLTPSVSIDRNWLQHQHPGIQVLELATTSSQPGEQFVQQSTNVFQAVQQYMKDKSRDGAWVQVISTTDDDHLATGLFPLLRTAWLENPAFAAQVITIDPSTAPLRYLPQELPAGVQRISYSGGIRKERCWTAIDSMPAAAHPWKPGGSYLITGGAGGIGFLMAQTIANSVAAPTLLLTGRSAPNASLQAKIDTLQATGAIVAYYQTDITDKAAVIALMQDIRQRRGPLTGILHCAGVIQDDYIVRKTTASFQQVLAPKVSGIDYLDELTADQPLEFLLLFSSVAGALGNAGQVDYAAANGYLDGWAARRNRLTAQGQRHGHTLSINWPLWQAGGMQLPPPLEKALLQQWGMELLETSTALAALYAGMQARESQVLVAPGNVQALRHQYLPSELNPSLSTNTIPTPVSATIAETTAIQYFKGLLSDTIKRPVEKIDADTAMEAYGIDSILVMQLTSKLETVFGLLPKTLFFEYQNLRELTQYFLEKHATTLQQQLPTTTSTIPPMVTPTAFTTPATTPAPQPGSAVSNATQDADGALNIAIIGLAGRYPQADTLQAFWQNLQQGKDCITEIPADRWDYRKYYDADKEAEGKTYSKWGGFLNDVDKFDPLYFNISPSEAERMDPQERLFLQTVHEVIEDAGYTRQTLRGQQQEGLGSQVGVYVGVMYEEYQLFGAQETQQGRPVALWGLPSSIANRVSYYFDLHGPSMALDTMCSSSLTAIHLACESLIRGKCAMAIAGGVNVSIHPNKYLFLSQGRFVSGKGRCESFGTGGDGYVPGEGVGAVLLKPLQKAIEEGDHIYGVIRSTAINHGGKTNGYTVPNPKAQAAVISKAFHEAGIDARSISYIEAHGTGTSLGDPIEILGLGKALSAYTTDTQYCSIGSVKSNIGHCESAAGIAGVTKVLLQLKHRQLVPSLHSATLNSHIDFGNSPFYVQQQLNNWQRPVLTSKGQTREYPLTAGISSFGAGGANAHIVIEEYIPVATAISTVQGPSLIVLSAPDEDQLKHLVHQWLQALTPAGQAWWQLTDTQLPAIAYTLQTGREHHASRLAVWASSLSELEKHLSRYLEQPTSNNYLDTTHQQLPIDAATVNAWLKGEQVNWPSFHAQAWPKLSLPSYPFKKERYWIGDTTSATTFGAPQSFLHPFLHENVSDLEGQRFKVRFTGRESFLQDHIVNNRQLLPAVVQLEMIRAAVQTSLPAGQHTAHLRFHQLSWAQPLVVTTEGIDLYIDVTPTAAQVLQVSIYSMEAGTADKEIYCQAQATVGTTVSEQPTPVHLPPLTQQHHLQQLTGAATYAAIQATGLRYGPSLQAIDHLYIGQQSLLARLALPAAALADSTLYLHPALLDAALQATLCWAYTTGTSQVTTYLPYAMEAVELYKPVTGTAWAYITGQSAQDPHQRLLDITVFDDTGATCIHLKGVALATPAANQAAAATETLLFLPAWKPAQKNTNASAATYDEHLVVACGLPTLAATLPGTLPGTTTIEITQANLTETAIALFEILKARQTRKGNHSVQVLIPATGEPPLYAALSGLLRTARKEQPNNVYQLITLPVQEPLHQLPQLLADSRQQPLEEEIRYVAGKREVLHWQVQEAADKAATTGPWKNGGVYLLTGGAGGLGLLFAREIARQVKNATIVLTGRSPLDTTKQPALIDIQALGARISYRQADITDQQAVEQLVRSIREDYGALHGIMHSAGVLRDNYLYTKQATEWEAVLAPKVDGVQYLDAASKDLALDCFICFSSVTGALGNAGQADYAVANAFMDHFAAYRNAQVQSGTRSGHTLSLNWPLWAAGGMQVSEAAEAYLYHTFGMTPMPTDQGFAAFYKAWALQQPRVMVIAGDRARILDKIASPAANIPATPLPSVAATTMSASELTEPAVHYLRKMLSAILKLPAEKIGATTALETYGIDSVMVMKMTARLEKAFGPLPKTLFFEYRTLQDLAQYFIQEHNTQLMTSLGIQPTPAPAIHTPPTDGQPNLTPRWRAAYNTTSMTPQRTNKEIDPLDIAIVGVSGKYPQAATLAEFWHNLCQGKDCITEIPADRWDYHTYFDTDRNKKGKTYSKWGGFLNDVAAFDALFFNISPLEAEYLDPQERLFLQCVQETLEDAGYNRQSLAGNDPAQPANIGVYVGVMYEEYQLYGAQHQGAAQQQALFGNPSSIANRVSFYYNFNGPSMAVDTMCSSSLTAIHLACQSIHNGECTAAIAGGVNLTLHPNKYLLLAQGRFISSKGRCESFGIGGDGYVPAEGVGAVLLKPLAQALQDGDQVYGVIKSTSINHGGRTNGYTVPNPTAQAAVISKAHQRAGIDPRTISYLEAHGTGTSLGDPIEIAGLRKAYQQYTADKQFCAIGSVKSNIGHSESAAGMAGLTKILLQLKHQTLVPSLHAATLNPHIDFDNSPFVVQQTLAPWQAPQLTIDGRLVSLPRRAGLSSFGAGGANAHLLIEEFEATPQPALPPEPVLILLSAKNAERLRLVASRLAQHLQQAKLQDQHLQQIAYTLQVGREALESRLATVVHTIGELTNRLTQFATDPAAAEELYLGRIERDNGTIEAFTTDDDLRDALNKWISRKKLTKLAAFWVKGLPVQWAGLYTQQRPRRISLPAYPFAAERYWVPALPETGSTEVPLQQPPTPAAQTLLLQPAWQPQPAMPATAVTYTQHYLLLAGISAAATAAIANAFPAARIASLPEAQHLADHYTTCSLQLFHTLQTLQHSKPGGKVLIQVVANNTVSALAGLYALLQTAQLENPSLIGQYITVSPDISPSALTELIGQNSHQPETFAVRYVAQQRQQLGWEQLPAATEHTIPWQEGHTYLITGGAGGIGLLFAREIVQQLTTGTVVLTGRTPAADRQYAMADLQGRGVTVVYQQTDITDAAAVQQLVSDIRQQYGGLHGIIHSAGITHDSYLIHKTDAEWHQVLPPKVAGLLHLDEATKDQPLGWFITCSSIAGALGNAGQADYAAANAFMDAWAQERQLQVTQGTRQGHTLSINWPLWQEGGMQLSEAMQAALYQRTGLVPLPTQEALQACYRAIATRNSQVMVLHGDAATLQQNLLRQRQQPLATVPTPTSSNATRIDKAALRTATIEQLKALFGQTVKLPADRIDAREEFQAYGLNSVMIVQLNQQLEKVFGQLSKTLFYEYQHLAALADYLLQDHEAACWQWSGLSHTASPATKATVPVEETPANTAEPMAIPQHDAAADDPIAIIGLSGRYPQAPTLEAFWQNLQAGKDCITEIPADRWPLQDFFEPNKEQAIETGKSYSKWGGFLEGFAHFDPLFFNISPREANTMDPQERLFLQAAWQALEDAAYTRERLMQQYQGRIGVFAGITKTGFEQYGAALEKIGEHSHLRTSFSSVANRVSWHFNLRGPSMPVDTMCSSSLTAIHEACASIRTGACAMALAGGVNLYLHPSNYTGLCSQSFLATDGRCRSFGEGGSGFVPGEGVGVVLLKRLSQAIADGDTIHAVIKATSVNHGGKTSGYTVPNPQLQAALIHEALQQAGINAASMGYIEAHGTGTSLGDPIEITGLTKAFRQDTNARQYCAIGSVKSNIGHLEAAAGIAGITKIILQMKHGLLAPSLHAEQLNPHIHFEQTPFYVQRGLTPWERPVNTPRRAGISSFGAGGSNAHVILEEYIPATTNSSLPVSDTGTTLPVYIVLSARNQRALVQRARQLLQYVRELVPASPYRQLLNIAYTLQTGREAMEAKWATQVTSWQELAQALTAFIAGEEPATPPVDLLHRWLQGEKIAWSELYQHVHNTAQHPTRINLPVYPFEQKPYWLPGLLLQEPAQDTQWLFTTEEWQEQPQPAIDWNQQMRSYAGQSLAILYTREESANQLSTLLRKLEKAAALQRPLRIHQVALAAWTPEKQAAIRPQVILVMGPGKTSRPSLQPVEEDIKNIYNCLQAGMQATWDEPMHGYYCYETTAADPRPDLTALHGLFLSAQKENPQHVWKTIQLHDTRDTGVACQQLLKEWLSSDPHGTHYAAIKIDGAQRYAWQLAETTLPPATQPAFRQHGTYLIAGGMGYIGGELLQQLASRYQANLLIVSQGTLNPERQALCDRLRAAGANVAYYSCDITNREALQQTYNAIKQEWGSLHGVINLARRHDSKSILTKTWSSFWQTSQAKVQGTLNLDSVTQHEQLDHFILFASIGGYGARGDADYAWSVSFQNAFAHYRNQLVQAGQRKGRSISQCWGPWIEDRLFPESRQKMSALGLDLITMPAAFPCIAATLSSPHSIIGLCAVLNKAQVQAVLGMHTAPPATPVETNATAPADGYEQQIRAWEEQKRAGHSITLDTIQQAIPVEAMEHMDDSLVERIYSLCFDNDSLPAYQPESATNQQDDLLPLLRQAATEILQTNDIDHTKTLQHYGLDSIMAMRLAANMAKKLTREIMPKWLLEYPTLQELAQYLNEQKTIHHGVH